jgi:energy-coupling factor transport system ATP-binding protein
MDKTITLNNVTFVYKHSMPTSKAINCLNLSLSKKQFTTILGRNGSGKSTLAKLINALLHPNEGKIIVNGMDTGNNEKVWDIRKYVSVVFQNPDNCIIGTIVEEDIAFGPENTGVEAKEIRKRVNEAMEQVEISEFANHPPHMLSGGQKQRVAIAGSLAMKPEYIILDESTSMLDPNGREEVITILKKLNIDEKIGVLLITHHMDEAIHSDRVIVMDHGKVVIDGTPSKVFSKVNQIKELGLEVPAVTELFLELCEEGLNLPYGVLTKEQAIPYLIDLLSN